MMPVNLVFVRHGLSEGNIANKRSRAGDHSEFTEAFRARHSSLWRLTDLGNQQIETAGEWIDKNIGRRFDRRMTSAYIRAMESAYRLHTEGPPWYIDFNLRERDYGALDVLPENERNIRYKGDLQRREIEPFFWRPARGESIAQVCQRMRIIYDTLHRECSDMSVIVVCHGEVMWANRVLLERMTQPRYRELDKSEHPFDHIHNGQVLHYTRRNPETQELAQKLSWMRSVCPTNLSLSSNNWQEIRRPTFTDADLLAEVERIPRLITQ